MGNINACVLDNARRKVLNAREERLEALEPADAFINEPTGIDAANGAVGEVPFAIIEAEALVNEPGRVRAAFLVGRPRKKDLTAIAVARPFVEDVRAQERRAQARHATEQPVGQEVNGQCRAGLSGEP